MGNHFLFPILVFQYFFSLSRTLHTWNELSGVSLQRGLVAPEGSALEEVARGRCPAAVEKTGKASPALGKEKDSNKLQ